MFLILYINIKFYENLKLYNYIINYIYFRKKFIINFAISKLINKKKTVSINRKILYNTLYINIIILKKHQLKIQIVFN